MRKNNENPIQGEEEKKYALQFAAQFDFNITIPSHTLIFYSFRFQSDASNLRNVERNVKKIKIK